MVQDQTGSNFGAAGMDCSPSSEATPNLPWTGMIEVVR